MNHESVKNSLQIEIETVGEIFFQVDSLLDLDKDIFWDMPLYGPMLFVNPENRSFIANQDNENDSFDSKNGVFIGTIPNEFNLANTAFNWGDLRWTMVLLPLPEHIEDRNRLIIHELFHRIQPELGFDLPDLSNNHLDTFEGRLLLKLELEALKSALSTKSEMERKSHIKNALFFRSHRYQNDEIKSAENSLEINEGLAEYTALSLGARAEDETIKHIFQSIERFYSNPTFIRSFAYQTTPIYGYLLARTDEFWHKKVKNDTNLTDLFLNAFSVDLPSNKEYKSVANGNDYNYPNILEQETIREEERISTIEGYKKKFLVNSGMKLFLENMSISFDPRNLIPLDEVGTIYPNLRITDNWGILSVDSGAMVSSDWSYVIVTKPIEISDELVKGTGWTLELNLDWEVSRENEVYIVRKK